MLGVVFVVGFALVISGIAIVSPVAAMIATGTGLMIGAFVVERSRS